MLKKVKNLVAVMLCLTVLLTVFVACDNNSDDQVNRDETLNLTFALDWTPNTNHSGLFLAKERGYYEDLKLNIDFQESDMNFIEMVANGSAAFGMAAQEQVLQARASDAEIPVVAIAAILQHNTSGFASPKERGIESPKDFEGKTYSGWGTELELAFIKTLMDKSDADFDKVNIINQSASNYIASMETEADFAWIFYGWDGVNCELQDYPINFIDMKDIDKRLDFYSPVLITNEEMIEKHPDVVQDFLKATAKGYTEAIEDPEAAVDALMEAAPELNRDMLMASQEWLNKEAKKSDVAWGQMDDQRWEDFAQWMKDNELLDNEIKVKDAYSTKFLPKK